MPASAEYIHEEYKNRESRLSERFARMDIINSVYTGKVDLPLPAYAKIDQPGVPNLAELGTDQLGRRIASVLGNLQWPSLHPGFEAADKKSDDRRRVSYGWWEANRYPKLMRRRGRWFVSYASAPVVIRPDNNIVKGGGPKYEVVHPKNVFPCPSPIGTYAPDDCIIRHKRPYHWLMERYPDQMARLRKSHEPKPYDMYTVLEHITPEYMCMVVCAQEVGEYSPYPVAGSSKEEILFEIPNLAEMCWVVIPERDCLDEPQGQFDTSVGMYVQQAAMMAMHVHATVKAIWPTPVLQNPNGIAVPDVIQAGDPETGEPMIVVNGVLSQQQLDPSYRGLEVMDRLEASQRQTAALPPEFGGTGGENVRTGRRGSQVMAASIDFTIAEAQDAFAEAASEEFKRAAAIDKGWYNTRKSFHVSWKGAFGKVSYLPSETFEENAVPIVRYPISGTDLSDLVINGGQRLGQGTLSREKFMEIDPLVDDVDAEMQRLRFEQIEQVFFDAMRTMAADPAGPWQVPDVIRFARKMLAEGKSWYIAAQELQEEKQQEQAEMAPQGAPETMPGLAMPGQGAEVPSGVPGLGPGSEDVTALLSQLGVADQAIRMR